MAEKRQLKSRITNFVQDSLRKASNQDITNIGVTYKQAMIIGLTQGVACIPGISRSGSTIAIGRMCGAEDTTRYSFLISIPIIIASFVMELIGSGGVIWSSVNIAGLIVAFVLCFVIGILCIKVMTRIVANNKLTIFAYYLIGLSAVLVVMSFF